MSRSIFECTVYMISTVQSMYCETPLRLCEFIALITISVPEMSSTEFEKVKLIQLNDFGEPENSDSRLFHIEVKFGEESLNVILSHQSQVAYQFCITSKCEYCPVGRLALALNLNNVAVMMKFSLEKEALQFCSLIKNLQKQTEICGKYVIKHSSFI